MAGVVEVLMKPVSNILDLFKDRLNSACTGLEPWKIVVYTCGTTLVVLAVKRVLFKDDSDTLQTRTKRFVFRWLKKIPYLQQKINEEYDKARKEIVVSLAKDLKGMAFIQSLPEKGLSENEVIQQLEKYKALDTTDWKAGQCSGCVYSGDRILTDLITKTYGMFAWTNPLHTDVFPDVRKMEAEVVRMCCVMFNGDSKSCGTMTGGGTESILMACLAYRNRARERGIQFPEMIIPVTAHAAFDKAAFYFRMRVTHIAVDKTTQKVDVRAMRRAISRNTCMLVGSAPQFPHGIVDDITEISELGRKYNIPVHMDCCLGGFILPFMSKAGFDMPILDFRLPGLTSISCDTHKYGFTPKGSSVVLYRDSTYRVFQYFSQPNWPGGLYATPSLGGSRAGAIIAATWATLMYMGEAGYVDSTKRIVNTARYIRDEIKKINGITLLGEPLMSVVAIGSDDFNIFRLHQMMTDNGWMLNPLQFPSGLHICITLPHTMDGAADRFLKDIREFVSEIMKDPKLKCEGAAALYGTSQMIPDRSMVSDFAVMFLDNVYSTASDSAHNGPMSERPDKH